MQVSKLYYAGNYLATAHPVHPTQWANRIVNSLLVLMRMFICLFWFGCNTSSDAHACNLLTTKVLRHWSLSRLPRHWRDQVRLHYPKIAEWWSLRHHPDHRRAEHTGTKATCIGSVVWVLLRNYCGLRGRGEHSVVDSIEKLGDLRIARGGFKERIMGPVTTAPLAMADCISSGCLSVCLQPVWETRFQAAGKARK